MKIAPALWLSRRKTPKIRRFAEAFLWVGVGVFGTLALTASPAAARLSAPAAVATPQFELSSASYRRACLKRVLDLSDGRSEQQLVAELNERCFALTKTSPAGAVPRMSTCANAFTWGPALAASPRTGPCFRQSRAGLPPGWSQLA